MFSREYWDSWTLTEFRMLVSNKRVPMAFVASLRSFLTWVLRFVRGLNLVNRIPAVLNAGLQYFFTL